MSERLVHIVDAAEVLAEAGDLTMVCVLTGFLVDVVAEPTVPRQSASRLGVEACVVLEERVAELLDVEVLAAEAGIGSRS